MSGFQDTIGNKIANFFNRVLTLNDRCVTQKSVFNDLLIELETDYKCFSKKWHLNGTEDSSTFKSKRNADFGADE